MPIQSNPKSETKEFRNIFGRLSISREAFGQSRQTVVMKAKHDVSTRYLVRMHDQAPPASVCPVKLLMSAPMMKTYKAIYLPLQFTPLHQWGSGYPRTWSVRSLNPKSLPSVVFPHVVQYNNKKRTMKISISRVLRQRLIFSRFPKKRIKRKLMCIMGRNRTCKKRKKLIDMRIDNTRQRKNVPRDDLFLESFRKNNKHILEHTRKNDKTIQTDEKCLTCSIRLSVSETWPFFQSALFWAVCQIPKRSCRDCWLSEVSKLWGSCHSDVLKENQYY